jgi:hypothetical protein
MRKSFASIAIACCAAIGTAASAGPFGIEQGQPLSSLKVLKHVRGNYYTVTVPSPHSNFEAYTVLVTPEDGVCKIAAIGKTLEGDAEGYEARRVYDNLKAGLQAKYGKSKDFDFLHSGSIWNKPNEWAMSLKQKERSLSSFWDQESGSTLPPDINSIMLDANAVSSTGTYVNVSYEFSNFSRCKNRIDKANNSVL